MLTYGNMKLRLQLLGLISAVLVGIAVPAYGEVFNYKFSFTDGSTISGQITGDVNVIDSELIDVTTVDSLVFTSTLGSFAKTLPVATARFDTSTFAYAPGPIVSTNSLRNNFVFSNDGDELAAPDGVLAPNAFYFAMFNGSIAPGGDNQVSWLEPDGLPATIDETYVRSQWELTAATSASVPDSGSSAVMLTCSIGGLLLLRRKFSRV
jgi:hypothetical protein